MHPTLLIDFARDLSAERIRTAQRERLIRAAHAARANGASRRDRAALVNDTTTALVDDTTTALVVVPAR